MLPDSTETAERLTFAVTIAQEAGDLTLKYFRRGDLKVDRKADASPVTIADREAELYLRERIAKRYPGDAIFGEEFGQRSGTTGFKWTLDPIDGTKSFIHGIPMYSNLVAVLQNDDPLIGVINVPALGEAVYAAKGSGCWYIPSKNAEPKSAHVSNTA